MRGRRGPGRDPDGHIGTWSPARICLVVDVEGPGRATAYHRGQQHKQAAEQAAAPGRPARPWHDLLVGVLRDPRRDGPISGRSLRLGRLPPLPVP